MDHFDAFISYSHAADGRLAPAVQSGLQRLAKRVFQRRALRVFRDETGLSTNPHLWGSIETAIDASEWFVLLASPESAASGWVDREVSTWVARKPLDHLLVVVTDGELVFQPEEVADSERTTCLPPSLVAALASEPRWLDLRWARDDAQLDLRNGRFRAAIADLAAPMHDMPKDDLEGDDVRQQKRAKRLAVAGAGLIAMLAVIAAITAVVATDQRTEAQSQRNRAEAEAARATAKSLASQATALTGTDATVSLLLAAEGYRLDQSLDTESGLLTALNGARLLTSLSTPLPDDVSDLAVSPNRSALYVLTLSGDLQAYSTTTLQPMGAPLVTAVSGPWSVDVSDDGSTLAIGTDDGVTVVDVATGEVAARGIGTDGSTAVGALNRDGSMVAVNEVTTDMTSIIDVATGSVLGEVTTGAAAAEFLGDERVAIQALGSTELTVYGLDPSGLTPERVIGSMPPGGGLTLSPDSTVLLAGGLEGSAILLDAATLELRGPVVKTRGSRTGDFFFNEDSSLAGLSSDDGSVTIIDTSTGFEVTVFEGLTGSLVSEFTGADTLVSTSTSGGGSATWSLDGRSAIGDAQSVPAYVGQMRSINGGSTVVAALIGETDSEVIIAPSYDVGSPSVARTFGTLIRAIDVAESAGLVAVYVLDFTDDGTVTGRRIHVASLDDLHDVTLIDAADDPDFVQGLEGVSLSPDGALLAVGHRNGRLSVYDVATGERVLEPMDVDEYPCCLATLAWSPEGGRLHTGGQDGVLRTLDTSTWTLLGERVLAEGQFALRLSALAPDDATLIVPSESGEVFLVDASTGEPRGEPFVAAGTQLQRATLVREGTVLAAQGRDGKLRLWDVATHRSIGPALATNGAYTESLERVSDTVVVSGGEGAVVTWDLDPASWMERACRLAGRNLTSTEWAAYVGGEYRATCEQWPAAP